jgi:hypothetical protein
VLEQLTPKCSAAGLSLTYLSRAFGEDAQIEEIMAANNRHDSNKVLAAIYKRREQSANT